MATFQHNLVRPRQITLEETMPIKRIDAVFDVYWKNSIKNAEKSRRGRSDVEYKNIIAASKTPNWKTFLAFLATHKFLHLSVQTGSLPYSTAPERALHN